jgi:hypothetical protein
MRSDGWVGGGVGTTQSTDSPATIKSIHPHTQAGAAPAARCAGEEDGRRGREGRGR